MTYLSQKSFLNPPLHQPGEVSVVFHIQMSSDYRGAAWWAEDFQYVIQDKLGMYSSISLQVYIIPDVLGGIDDLFDARNPQSDVHGCYASKVEGFQCHLSAGLSNALGTKGPYSWAWLHLSSRYMIQTHDRRQSWHNFHYTQFSLNWLGKETWQLLYKNNINIIN